MIVDDAQPSERSIRGVIPVLVLVGLIALGTFVYVQWRKARDEKDLRGCAASLRMMGQGMMMFALDHQNQVPASENLLETYLGETLKCPWAARRGRSVNGGPAGAYVYVAPPGKFKNFLRPAEIVAAYEPLSYHDGVGSCVLYLDGHANWLPEKDAAWLIKEVEAGRNPPNPRPFP